MLDIEEVNLYDSALIFMQSADLQSFCSWRDSNLLTQIWGDSAGVMDGESYVKRRKVQTSDWKQHIEILRNKEK